MHNRKLYFIFIYDNIVINNEIFLNNKSANDIDIRTQINKFSKNWNLNYC